MKEYTNAFFLLQRRNMYIKYCELVCSYSEWITWQISSSWNQKDFSYLLEWMEATQHAYYWAYEFHWNRMTKRIINFFEWSDQQRKHKSSHNENCAKKKSCNKNRKHGNLTIQTLHIIWLICMPMANAHNFSSIFSVRQTCRVYVYYYSNFLPLHFKSFFWLILCVRFFCAPSEWVFFPLHFLPHTI